MIMCVCVYDHSGHVGFGGYRSFFDDGRESLARSP